MPIPTTSSKGGLPRYDWAAPTVRLRLPMKASLPTKLFISAPNPDLKLKPRLTANVTIYILDKQNVLSVPSRALRFTPEYPLIERTDIVVDCEGEANCGPAKAILHRPPRTTRHQQRYHDRNSRTVSTKELK